MSQKIPQPFIKFIPELQKWEIIKPPNSEDKIGLSISEEYQAIISDVPPQIALDHPYAKRKSSTLTYGHQNSADLLMNSCKRALEKYYIEFICFHCGWVRAQSVTKHNLSIDHLLKEKGLVPCGEHNLGQLRWNPDNVRAMQMMMAQGRNGSSGLGRNEQDRLNPVQATRIENGNGIGQLRWNPDYVRAVQMMMAQGWNGTSGLGRNEQGRLNPVQATRVENRHGIGFRPESRPEPRSGSRSESRSESRNRSTKKTKSKYEKTTKSIKFLSKKEMALKEKRARQMEYQFRMAFHEENV